MYGIFQQLTTEQLEKLESSVSGLKTHLDTAAEGFTVNQKLRMSVMDKIMEHRVRSEVQKASVEE